MMQLASDNEWLKRGRQKAAVAQILRRPMTSTEIWRAAQAVVPRIQLRDVWFILRQMERRQLLTCFNPKEATGKVYYWSTSATPVGVNWRGYAFVVRAKVRRLVLHELAQRSHQPAAQIRRRVNEHHSVSLNAVIRALHDLQTRRHITVSGEGDKRGQKVYRLTPSGRSIANQLLISLDNIA